MNLGIVSTSRNALKNRDTTYMTLRHPSCILLHVNVFNRSTRMQIFKQQTKDLPVYTTSP